MHSFEIAGRKIGPSHPTYIIAEMSANHGGSLEHALRVVREAKACGADAVKLQTYTADTLTIRSDAPAFRIGGDGLWGGRMLHDLYAEAYTPWEWQPKLKQLADDIGIDLFSTPFDPTSVDFLEKMNVPAYKIGSFEMVDIPLIEAVARKGKPIIMSTGMATIDEVFDAVSAVRNNGNPGLALLKCTSAYPAPAEELNVATIPHLAQTFGLPAGLSDHTMGSAVPCAAVALGACIVEKHFCLSRSEGGPDSAFSMEPAELRALVDDLRKVEKAIGRIDYTIGEQESKSRAYRRSLFVVEDVAEGERFTPQNVRSIRPADGLAPKYLNIVLGHRAGRRIERGTPMSWNLLGAKDD